jgi:hypothetical protein
LEICAVEIETKATKLIIFCLYRAPTGDFDQFIKCLDDTLKLLYKPKAEFKKKKKHGNVFIKLKILTVCLIHFFVLS